MALRRRDLLGAFDSAVGAISSAASSVSNQVESAVGVPASATSNQATTTGSVKSTASSGASTTSVKATTSTKSNATTKSQSTKPASSSTDSAAASGITSSSSTSSTSTITSGSPSSTSSDLSSTISSSTLVRSTTSTAPAPPPTSTPLPSSTDDGNHVSSVGIAVAAVFGLLILCGVIYLLWKYLPAARRYRERAYPARSHRKGLSFDDEESTDMQLDDPKAGLGLRRYSFITAPTYYPGQTHESDLSQHRPLTSVSSQDHIVSPASIRHRTSLYEHTVPSALQIGSTRYMPYAQHDVRASQIGLAMPFRSPSPEKDLPPVPLPSVGYGKDFS